MANDSSTGGFLAPTSTGGDLNDDALQDFLQTIIVGITGLAGNLVRPRWQDEPPNVPDAGTNWAAIGPGERERERFSARKQTANGVVVIRNRILQILCSFYGPDAETNGELLAMGFEVPQNREALTWQNGAWSGFNLVGGVEGPVIAPALIKGKWYYKADYTFKIRQQQQYTYPVLTLEQATATLDLQEPGVSTPITETLDVIAPPG
ncbi:MAG: hypothetical protein ACLGPM_07685 [Acidobacteriota bacterium]